VSDRPVDLRNLRPAPGAVTVRTRVGRGTGSGLGKTSGRGHKGAGARSGGKVTPGFEGGQMPLARRLPKRGFRNSLREPYQIVAVARLERFPAGTVVNVDRLRAERIVHGRGPIKILGDGDLSHALTVRIHALSASARRKIEAAGGTVEVIPA